MTDAGLRIVVWHRHRFVREALAEALVREPDVKAAVAAGTVQDICDMARLQQATTCLVDLDDPSGAHWATIQDISSATSVRVIGLTDQLVPLQAQQAYRVGVSGIVEAGNGLAGVVAELRPSGWRATSFHERNTTAPLLDDLERDVLRLIASGLTARAVAEELGVSGGKIDAAKRRVFAKLGVQQQAHAVAVAISEGLLEERRNF
jgi:DNA-binding NarL/FixJ family response regulator